MLTKFDGHFRELQGYLQAMVRAVRFEGEISVEEYCHLCEKAVASARNTLSGLRLLIPQDLAQQCDHLLTFVFEAQTHYAYARAEMINGNQRAEFWNRARNIAYEEIPSILQQMERAARDVIHGEPLSG